MSVAIQLDSHDLPPSSENACSKRHVSAVAQAITKRTNTGLPSSVSKPKNSPRPSLNPPTTGAVSGAAQARVVEAPLPGFGVVEAQRNAGNRSRRSGHVELHQIRAAIHDRADDRSAVEIEPFLLIRKAASRGATRAFSTFRFRNRNRDGRRRARRRQTCTTRGKCKRPIPARASLFSAGCCRTIRRQQAELKNRFRCLVSCHLRTVAKESSRAESPTCQAAARAARRVRR